MKQDDRIYMYRHGFLEETFFNWSVVPLVGGDGSVVALYNPAFENTKRKVNERRMFTLREVGERTALARDMKSFWGLVQKGLEYNELDVPFALIYSVFEDSESDVSSMHSASLSSAPQIMLEGSLGVPADHPAAVSNIDLRTSNEGFAPYMRETMVGAGTPVVLSREAGTLPSVLVDGLEAKGGLATRAGPWSCSGCTRPRQSMPSSASSSLGTNPRRPYDADYQLFVDLLSRQLATSMGVGGALRGGDQARPASRSSSRARPPGALAAAPPTHAGSRRGRGQVHPGGRARTRGYFYRQRPRLHYLLQRHVVGDFAAPAVPPLGRHVDG